MTYYPTLDEDLARAKEILGRSWGDEMQKGYPDIYAAYKLLESFVQHIERSQFSEPHIIGTDAPNDENDPVGRFHTTALADLASRLLDMVERVEWVPRESGHAWVCPFCHGISERDGGPGHLDDCEWEMVTREGNELRLKKVLR